MTTTPPPDARPREARGRTATTTLAALAGMIGASASCGAADEKPPGFRGTLEAIREEHDLPALGAVVFTGDEILALEVVGLRRRDDREHPATRDDKFHLGSCTKSMTATLAALLVDEGTIAWETTVGEVLGETAAGKSMDPGFAGVTLRDLLANRGGVPGKIDPVLWAEVFGSTAPPREQREKLVRGTLRHAPAHAPGTTFEYSNAGFAIAGHLMEVIAGEDWESLMRRRLFGPLGMRSAGFGAPATPGEVDQPWGHHPRPVEPGPLADNPAAIGPAGTVHASLADWARYGQLHLGSGAIEAIDAGVLRALHDPLGGGDYALGWAAVDRGWAGGRALTHTGSNTMWFCVIWLAPERNFGVAVAANDGRQVAAQACDRVAAAAIQAFLEEGAR